MMSLFHRDTIESLKKEIENKEKIMDAISDAYKKIEEINKKYDDIFESMNETTKLLIKEKTKEIQKIYDDVANSVQI